MTQKHSNQYTEISVSTTHEASELVAYFLGEISPFGVTVFDDCDLDSISSWDYKEDDLHIQEGQSVQVKGYVESQNLNCALEYLQQSFCSLDPNFCGSLQISTKSIDPNEWLAIWQKTFVPIEIANLVVSPEWIDFEPTNAAQKVLKIQAGIAFGTGQHETTEICLNLLQEENLKGSTVCDIGCGSGILGLCSLLLDASSATLIDIDSQACDICLHNAKLNGLENKCEIILGNLADKLTQRYDIVVANLTAEILQILAKDIERITKPNGKIILSGILCDRADKVIDCFSACGFETTKRMQKGDWCGIVCQPKIDNHGI